MWGAAIAAAIGLAALWTLILVRNRRQVLAADRTGDPAAGIVLFIEPVRWLFVVWGFPQFARGLRRGGCPHYLRLFRWSNRAGALFVLPDLMRRARLDRKARRLARLLNHLAAQHPDRPIHLCGYSTGSYVALEALRHADRATVTTVVLLGPTVSPRYDFAGLAGRARVIHCLHSWLDLWINGVGPLVFGCNDRRWALSVGMVGLLSHPEFVRPRGWQAADLRFGYFGGHFTIASPSFVAHVVAPMLLAEPRAAPKAPVDSACLRVQG